MEMKEIALKALGPDYISCPRHFLPKIFPAQACLPVMTQITSSGQLKWLNLWHIMQIIKQKW